MEAGCFDREGRWLSRRRQAGNLSGREGLNFTECLFYRDIVGIVATCTGSSVEWSSVAMAGIVTCVATCI